MYYKKSTQEVIKCLNSSLNGLSKKEAIKKVSKDRTLPKNEVYQEALDM